MRILLDTQIALWAIVDHVRLLRQARTLIKDCENPIVVSAATVWEITIEDSISRGTIVLV